MKTLGINELPFPETIEESASWTHFVTYRALHTNVLCVAHTRIEGAWCAYCAAVPGQRHDEELEGVLRNGDKLSENVARVLFPRFDGIAYAD